MPRKARPRPRTLSAPVYKGLIPRTGGPKLGEFPHRKAGIRFLALLSDPDSEGQAHVFEVKIRSRIYALKIFKFYDDTEHEAGLWPHEQESVSLDKLHAHHDPFYNECRAFGQLETMKLNGKVAVRCHGYTTLPPSVEVELEQRFDVGEWEREDYDKPVTKRAAFRAVVKDLVRDDTPLTHRVLKKIKKDLLLIRKQGVYPCDIKASNYKGGLLVDLSNALTEPHYLFEIRPKYQVAMYKNEDLFQFDSMVKAANIKTWLRAMPDENTLRKLRKRDYLQEFYGWSTSSTESTPSTS